MKPPEDEWYVDDKGRTRWRRNEEIAERLKQLGDFLVIGGYTETHAARYSQLAYTIARYPKSVVQLYEDDQLDEIPGVADTLAGIIAELIETGTCAKMEKWARHTPKSVLELTRIPRLGAKTARLLYLDYGIDSQDALRKALREGRLRQAQGLGDKMVESLRRHLLRDDAQLALL